MSARERLMNYAATGDGTYLGVGCGWDLLTQCGRDRFGNRIGMRGNIGISCIR